MKTIAQLSATEIRDALRDYVERKTGDTVIQNGVQVSISRPPTGFDPREREELTAKVTYETT